MVLAAFRFTFGLLARFSTAAAARLALRIFRTPRRYATPPRERAAMAGAIPFDVQLGAKTRIRAWSWGDGPLVILMHGWEGRGSQMSPFAAPLVNAGYRVVTFDAPGHGASSGRKSSLPEFSWALRGVATSAGAPHAIIAHSLGCAATTLALRDGLGAQRVVFVAPPLEPSAYTEQFGEIFGLEHSVVRGLRERIEERFLRPWSDYSLAGSAPRMKAALLVVHDRDDAEVAYSGGEELAKAWPGARLMTTGGLGHRRVLRDPDVLNAAVAFISE